MNRALRISLMVALGFCISVARAEDRGPLGTAFTYQGMLELNGIPVNDSCDFYFELWDVESGGTTALGTESKLAVPVSEGLFTVNLDFGTGAFESEGRWLEIGVRCPADTGPLAPLSSRQKVTPTPNALYSGDAEKLGGVPASSYITKEEVTGIVISSLPYTIEVPGAYYLDQVLIGTNGAHGITIDTNDVTLDLNGFTLAGVQGSLDGIHVSDSKRNITVKNGIVRDWSEDGVDALEARNSQFLNLRIWNNGQKGLSCGPFCIIDNCSSTINENEGIAASQDCMINNSTSKSNGGHGILTGDNSTISNCTSSANLGHGIWSAGGCIITVCTARGNGGCGFYVIGGSISKCTAWSNGEHGIEVANRCIVLNNTCDLQGTGAGIRVSQSYCRVEANTVSGNQRGIYLDGAGNNIVIKNSAVDNGTDYDIAAGNTVGRILDFSGGGEIDNASPWANFRF